MHKHLSYELQVAELRSKIASEAQSEMSKEQKEYLLRQQLRAIQQELGEQNPEKAEVEGLRERLAKSDLPELVRRKRSGNWIDLKITLDFSGSERAAILSGAGIELP